MSVDRHLTAEEIELFVLRAHDQIDIDIEAHLSSCDSCGERLAREAQLELALREAADAASWCPRCAVATVDQICGRCGLAIAPGGYVVEEVLAEYAHGRTYLARDADGEAVRINELMFFHVQDNAVVDGFEKEVRLLKQLDHPGIPTLVDSFKEGDDEELRMYAVEEFVEGDTLDRYLEEHRMTEDEVHGVALQVLDVLVYLQSLSPEVYHRDVRPQNIIRRADGRVVLRQFAQARDLGVTGVFTLVGLTGYIPVEQHVGVVDKTSDLYGLGATLAHLLTRRPPLPNDPGLERANVTDRFRAWIETLMAVRPEDRFASAMTARDALLGVEAIPIVPRRRVRTWPFVLAAVLTAGTALGMWTAGVFEGAQEPPRAPPPSLPLQTGSISLESKPAGASIYLDGRPMTLPDGRQAITPSDVRSLVYDKTYEFRFEKKGYEPARATVHLASGQEAVLVELVPRPGHLVVDVNGDDDDAAIVYVDGEVVPRSVFIGRDATVVVSARLEGRPCGSKTVHIRPDSTTAVTLSCAPFKRTQRKDTPPPTRSSGPDAGRTSVTPAPSRTGDCLPRPGLPQGSVTISTKPFSEIFWDGKRLGQTPLARQSLPAGCVEIRAVSLDGKHSRTVRLTVEPNKVRIYSFRLSEDR